MTQHEYTRNELIEICEHGFSDHSTWSNRDSSDAVRQLGECYALLRAGCDFEVLRGGSLSTDSRTIWVDVTYDGFGRFDYGGTQDSETFYIPTKKRLETAGHRKDWY